MVDGHLASCVKVDDAPNIKLEFVPGGPIVQQNFKEPYFLYFIGYAHNVAERVLHIFFSNLLESVRVDESIDVEDIQRIKKLLSLKIRAHAQRLFLLYGLDVVSQDGRQHLAQRIIHVLQLLVPHLPNVNLRPYAIKNLEVLFISLMPNYIYIWLVELS